MDGRDRPLCSPREKVKSHRARSLFKNLKARFLEARRPPICAVKALVHQHRSKCVLEPGFFGNEHQEEIPAGLYDSGRFSERLLNPFAIQVLEDIRADDGVEGGRLEGKFAHIGSHNCSPVRHASGF